MRAENYRSTLEVQDCARGSHRDSTYAHTLSAFPRRKSVFKRCIGVPRARKPDFRCRLQAHPVGSHRCRRRFAKRFDAGSVMRLNS